MVLASSSVKNTVWLKLGKHFIDQDTIESLVEKGNGTIVRLFEGTEFFVDVPLHKVSALLLPRHL
jgi:hypothetical protein